MAEEKTLENRIKKFLKDKGCFYFKYWGGGIYTTSGIPDIISCVNGRFVSIEVKSLRGKVSDLQNHQMEKIRESGGIALVVTPRTYKMFEETIQFILDGEPVGEEEI